MTRYDALRGGTTLTVPDDPVRDRIVADITETLRRVLLEGPATLDDLRAGRYAPGATIWDALENLGAKQTDDHWHL